MVRKTVFTREDVVKAGLAVMQKDGVQTLSARRVAEEMGASTAPVYSNFANMEDLTKEVKMAAVEVLLACTREKYTDNEFLNMGVGVLEFARRHPQLYSALFLQANDECEAGPDVMNRMLDRMAVLPDLEVLPPVERVILLRKVSLFTHGLATMICNGMPPGLQWSEIMVLLDEVGAAVLHDALEKSPRSEEDLARLGSLCGIDPDPAKDGK